MLTNETQDYNIDDFRVTNITNNNQIKDGEELVRTMKNRSWKAFWFPVSVPIILFLITIGGGILLDIINHNPIDTWFFKDKNGMMGCLIFFLIFVAFGISNKEHTFNGRIFKKYGSPERIISIINEIETTKEIVIDEMIISKNYIMLKDYYESIVLCDDVLNIYIHKYKQCKNLVLVDKFNDHNSYRFSPQNEKYWPSLIEFLGTKCKNAKFGDTIENDNYVRENTVNID